MARCHAEQDERQCCHGYDVVFTDWFAYHSAAGAGSQIALLCS